LEKSSPPDYPALIDAAKVYAILLSKTQRQAQAELFDCLRPKRWSMLLK